MPETSQPHPPTTTIAAAILAGGQASRHSGIAKGMLTLPCGASIIERQIAELKSAGIRTIAILANAPEPYEWCGLPILPDLRTGKGPLGGMEAGLAHHAPTHDATLFLPCDLPGITAREITRLVEGFVASGALVAVAATQASSWHPLCVVVHNAIRETLSTSIDRGALSVGRLWHEIGATPVRFDDPTPFFNINTPHDMAQWQAMVEGTR